MPQRTFNQKLTANITQVVPTLPGVQQYELDAIEDPPKDEAEYTIMLDALYGPLEQSVTTDFENLMSEINFESNDTVYNCVRSHMQIHFLQDQKGGLALFQKTRKVE